MELVPSGRIISQPCLTALSHDRPFIRTKAGRGHWLEDGGDLRALSLASLLSWALSTALPHFSVISHPRQNLLTENVVRIFRKHSSGTGAQQILPAAHKLNRFLNTVMKHQKQSSNRQQYYKGRSKINREAPPRIPQSVPLNSQAAGTRSNVENIQRPPVLTDDVSRFQELPTSTALDVYLDKQQLQTILNIQPPCSHCWNKRETEEETWPSTFIAAEEGREEKAQRNPTRTFLP